MQHSRFRAPLILAIIVLLLPVLYVGVYFALVNPAQIPFAISANGSATSSDPSDPFFDASLNYRWGGNWSAALFWPIEQVDRRLRPGYWEPGWTSYPSLPPP